MLSKTFISKLETIRKDLHAHPEISEHEFETQKRILHFLEQNSSAKIQKIAKTGVLAVFNGSERGNTLMIRGDIDALPITEINTFHHRSVNTDVSHKCGHDGHTVILLGLAKMLSEHPIQSGKVLLLFQPAEENGMGAEAVLGDSVFSSEKIDFVYALHNLPGYAKHEVVVKENEFTGNVKSIIIKLNGKTSHAAEPELGHNPSSAISRLLKYADQVTLNNPTNQNFFLMTPIYVTMGELAYGISAGYGEVHFTIRSWSTALMKQYSKEIVDFVEGVCREEGLTPEISWTQVFHANVNNTEAVQFIRKAAEINQLKLTERDYPFKWGEDFGLFTQKYQGAMFGLGSGLNTPALHNPDYDFPDEITESGIRMFYQIINQLTE